MERQAKYLIDDAKYHIAGIATSWDYDNRAYSDFTDPFPGSIYDNASGIGVRVKRDFQRQTDSVLTLEMLYNVEIQPDGVKICMCSSDGTALFELISENGTYYFNGADTARAAKVGKNRIRIVIDLPEKTAKVYISGKNAGTYPINSTGDASKLYIGTTGKTEIKITPMKNSLTADYLVNETFLCTDSVIPDNWQIQGDFEILSHTAANPQMDYTYAAVSACAGSVHTAYTQFSRPEKDVICEGYFLLPEGSDGAQFFLMSGKEKRFGVYSSGGAFYAHDGTLLRHFTANVWQDIRFESTGNGKIKIKIDGKECALLEAAGGSAPFDGVCVCFEPKKDASMCFTDIHCESVIDYDDYCPEPKQVRHGEYEIGINVCNMWREGHHFGWDRITYFTDNTPLIGPYDEGLPEVADWEIKFMTEHGITFQHFCWYCPDPLINFPIKRSRMDAALRDGYMNARYSDKMKFIIMWENNTYKNTNPEDFKNYVWKYWCEYFFTDPRYLKIDNKPLLSLWSFAFVEHWGGAEKAKEIISFMNEDIKNYGCDGILLMATASSGNPERYRQMSEYCDLTYAYHFGTEGCYAEHQTQSIDALNALTDSGLAHFVQTVSVGFNAAPWHGADARCPLITPDDYESVLGYVKERVDNMSEKTAFDKLFMMSTWNEYGEGTYIMPSGIHGFEYLDRIRKVFVPESGKCDNLLPEGEALSRLSYLRIPSRAVIRRLGFEKNEEAKAPNKVVSTFDFSQASENQRWRGYNAAVKADFTSEGVRITPVASHEHYSLISNFSGRICSADDVKYIRISLRSPQKTARFRLAFLTDTDKRWANDKCEGTFVVQASDKFSELVFRPSKFPTWKGEITDIRLDSMTPTDFEVEKIELMTYEEAPGGDPSVYINGNKLKLAFEPILTSDGDMLVSLDPGYCAFRALKLYHEYDMKNKKLYVASCNTEAVFELGSDSAEVGSEKIKMRHAMTMRDGLPTFALGEFCDIMRIQHELQGKYLQITI